MPEKLLLTKEERRLKKQLRREKQREINILRAAKMHKLRLDTPTIKTSKKLKAKTPQIHVGCSGWFYWHWRGQFYPDEMATKDWFSHYSKNFKTVELNAPFYSWPTAGTVEIWKKQAGKKKFVYTVKVCELITHVKRFHGTKELVKDFSFIADMLGQQMGCFLFQLPPSFHYTPARLRSILSQLDHSKRNVVEFRHRSWWNEAVFAAFRKHKTIFCSCSGPRLPDNIIKTADDIYLRFHGTKQWYRHDYTREELKEWVEKIQNSAAKNIWIYFNNDRDGYAIKNARTMMRLLKGT